MKAKRWAFGRTANELQHNGRYGEMLTRYLHRRYNSFRTEHYNLITHLCVIHDDLFCARVHLSPPWQVDLNADWYWSLYGHGSNCLFFTFPLCCIHIFNIIRLTLMSPVREKSFFSPGESCEINNIVYILVGPSTCVPSLRVSTGEDKQKTMLCFIILYEWHGCCLA